MKKVELRIPNLEDMKYRKAWMLDPKTMSYNKGFNLDIPGYDAKTGTIKKSDEELQVWYKKWINNEPDRCFFYIYEVGVNTPIGETYFYKDDEKYKMGILIIDEYRGCGYSEPALRELMKIAFLKYGISELTDTFPISREAARKLFKKCGFVESNENREELIITKDMYMKNL